MKNFALIGAAGYIAPRHLKAIKETNNKLVAALDKSDSVGILDSFFPNTDFFIEYERFERHVDRLRNTQKKVDYVSICTPNYLHDSQIRFALRHEADAICEKPIVLNPWNIDALQAIEKETNHNINTILQLRLHPSIIKLKEEIDNSPEDIVFDVDLTYMTSRGHWYFTSWKADTEKSGGIATNIGVHFYDMLSWVFGDVEENKVHVLEPMRAAGYLKLKKARVRWFLCLDFDALPKEVKAKGQRTYRSITIGDREIEFSGGFTDLHTESYRNILEGNGFSLEDARKSIQIVHEIRNSAPLGLKGDYHPFASRKVMFHPFKK